MNSQVIDILIDTNILFDDAFLDRSEHGKWLKALGKDKKINLHICKVIEYEIKTQLQGRLEKNIKKLKEAQSILYLDTAKSANRQFFDEITDRTKKYESNFNKNIEEFYDLEFIIRQESFKEHVDEIFMDYFKGEGNFRSLKFREDIPDGFIYQYVKKFNKPIICVTKDGQLNLSLKKISNAAVYSNLNDAFKSEQLIQAKEQYEAHNTQKLKRDLLLNFIQSYDLFKNNHPFNVEEHLKFILQDHLFDSDYLPSIDNEAVLQTVYNFELSTNDEVKISYAPEYSVAVSFNGSMNVDISYYAYNENVYKLEDYRASLSDLDQHTTIVEEEVNLECSFTFLISFVKNDLDEYIVTKVKELKKEQQWDKLDADFLKSTFSTDDVQLSEFKVLGLNHIYKSDTYDK